MWAILGQNAPIFVPVQPWVWMTSNEKEMLGKSLSGSGYERLKSGMRNH